MNAITFIRHHDADDPVTTGARAVSSDARNLAEFHRLQPDRFGPDELAWIGEAASDLAGILQAHRERA